MQLRLKDSKAKQRQSFSKLVECAAQVQIDEMHLEISASISKVKSHTSNGDFLEKLQRVDEYWGK